MKQASDFTTAWSSTYTQCGPLGGRVLPAVATMDTMSLHQLVSRRVGPEVVGRLHLRVLQSTRSNCHNEGSLLNTDLMITVSISQIITQQGGEDMSVYRVH